MNDQTIEQDIQAKGKTAPRITPADIEASIESEIYFNMGEVNDRTPMDKHVTQVDSMVDSRGSRVVFATSAMHCLTICILNMKNGFVVTGESACASPENFDAEIGRKIARANAVSKLWPLMGYELRTKLAAEEDDE